MVRLKDIQSDFNRSVKKYEKYGELQRIVAEKTADFFSDYCPTLVADNKILDIGSGTGFLAQKLSHLNVYQLDCAEQMSRRSNQYGSSVVGVMEDIPFADRVFDGVVSSLALQWCGDYSKVHEEINRVVKYGNRCILSTLGTATLKELKEVFLSVEGTSERVHDFIDIGKKNDYFITLKKENIIMNYNNLYDLLNSMRYIGAGNKNSSRNTPLTRSLLEELSVNYMDKYSAEEGVYATWEILYVSPNGVL